MKKMEFAVEKKVCDTIVDLWHRHSLPVTIKVGKQLRSTNLILMNVEYLPVDEPLVQWLCNKAEIMNNSCDENEEA